MKKLRLGVNLSMIFSEVPLIKRFALAKKMGFDVVEIQFPYELNIEQIQKQLVQYQLKLCLINVPTGDLMSGGLGLACQPNKRTEYQQAVHLAIEYAAALNVPKINVLAGRYNPSYSHQECFSTLIQNLDFTAEQCNKHRIQVVFELINQIDMPNFLVHSIQDVEIILQQVQHENITLQFDCYHFAMIGENVATCLQHYLKDAQSIGHIQFADYPHRHQPLTGSLNFDQIFNLIAQSNYEGYVCAEYKPNCPSIESFAWKQKYFNE